MKIGTLADVLAGLEETGNGKLEAGKADTVTNMSTSASANIGKIEAGMTVVQ